MTVTLQRTLKDAGATAAGQLVAPVFNIDGSGVSSSVAGTTFTQVFGVPTYYGAGDSSFRTTNCGYRKAFSGALDLTDRQFIQWRISLQSNPGQSGTQKKWANGGGIVMVFYDGSGNWAGYKISGGDDVWNFSNEGGGVFQGGSQGAFNTGGNLDSNYCAFFHLDRTRTPDYSSGTLNWASVAGYELHFRPFGSGMQFNLILGQLYTVDNPLLYGSGALTTGVTALRDNIASQQGINYFCQCFAGVSTLPMFGGAPSATYWTSIGFQAGDGGTHTITGTMAAGTLAFLNPPEDTHDTASPRYYGMSGYILPGTTSRLVDIYQGASDNVTFNDQSWASSRSWGVRVRGTPGTATFNRCVFTRPSQFEAAHGTYTDCLWDAPTDPVQITTATTLTRATVRNGTYGIKVVGAAGTYSGTIALGGASTYDIQVGSGGAGTYNLPNITASTTLKIRNDSAVNAVVVSIPGGIAYTTSTAGGSISVTIPAIYQSVAITGLVAGSRVQIYDVTSSTEMFNAIVAGTSTTWTDSVAAAASRAIRVRIAKVATVTAYNFLEANIGTCGTGTDAALTYLANQTLDTVYNSNVIDGSGVTGITITDSIDRVIISLAGGSVTWPSIYAYQCYWNFTALGIIDDGAIITASDTANYRVVGFKIRNSSAVPLTITGGFGVDSVTGLTATIIDSAGSTGNIYTSPEHVVAYQSSGGLSTSDRALLQSASDNSSNIASGASVVYANLVSVKGHTLTGSGAGPYV